VPPATYPYYPDAWLRSSWMSSEGWSVPAETTSIREEQQLRFIREQGPPDIDAWFKPFSSNREETMRIREWLLPARDRLYCDRGHPCNPDRVLKQLALSRQNNPLTDEEAKRRLAGTPYWTYLSTQMTLRFNDIPTQTFLDTVGVDSSPGWNYEPFYVEALMLNLHEALLEAKVKFTLIWSQDPDAYEGLTKMRFPSGVPVPPQ